MGSGLGLGTPGVILCPMGWSWGCLWGQGWVWGHLGSSHALWDGPGGVYGVRVGFGDIWVHPMPYGVILVVFMGSGLRLGTSGLDGSIRRTLGRPVWDFGHPLAHLGPCGATPHPPGRPWWYLWGLGWVWGRLGSSHALWGSPGGVYGVRVGSGDISVFSCLMG